MNRTRPRNRVAATLAAFFSATTLAVTFAGFTPPLAAKPGKGPRMPIARGRTSDPSDLLRRMLQAEANLAISGREVTQLATGRQSEQVVKRDPRRGLRLEYINPPGDLLVDDRRRSWFLSRERGQMVERASRLTEMGRAAQSVVKRMERGELRAYYDGRDVVAGREAHIVRVVRAEGGRGPARRFWIDAETGLRLKTEEVGAQGRVLSSSYFLSVDLHPRLSREDFEPPATPPGVIRVRERGQRFVTLAEAQKKVSFSLRSPAYVPPGFALRSVYVNEFRDHPVVSQRYTNGLNAFTLFQTNAELPPPRTRGGKLPPRVRTWRAGNLAFALIGNLPDDEMQRIADSVR